MQAQPPRQARPPRQAAQPPAALAAAHEEAPAPSAAAVAMSGKHQPKGAWHHARAPQQQPLRRGPPLRVAAALRALGVRTARDDDVAGQARHAAAMFGTSTSISPADAFGALRRLHVCSELLSASSPAGEGSALKANPITVVPRELFFVIRTVQLVRGLAHAMGQQLDVEAAWQPFAEVAICEAR